MSETRKIAVTVNGKLWDVAAPAAIVLEAGGKLTDLKGNAVFPFNLASYQGAKVPFLAAAPQAQQHLLAALHQAERIGKISRNPRKRQQEPGVAAPDERKSRNARKPLGAK